MKGSRISARIRVYRDGTTLESVPDGLVDLIVKPGQRLLLDFVTASQDPVVFAVPISVRFVRPLESYIHFD